MQHGLWASGGTSGFLVEQEISWAGTCLHGGTIPATTVVGQEQWSELVFLPCMISGALSSSQIETKLTFLRCLPPK